MGVQLLTLCSPSSHLSENGPSTTLTSIFYDAQGRRDQMARDALGATTGYDYDPVSRLEALTHDLDGSGAANDVAMSFAYNPASQIVTRTLTNDAYEFPLTSDVRTYAVNGLNQYTQVGGVSFAWDDNGQSHFRRHDHLRLRHRKPPHERERREERHFDLRPARPAL